MIITVVIITVVIITVMNNGVLGWVCQRCVESSHVRTAWCNVFISRHHSAAAVRHIDTETHALQVSPHFRLSAKTSGAPAGLFIAVCQLHDSATVARIAITGFTL